MRCPPRAEQRYKQRVADGAFPVADQDRALAFYTEKLGFAVATDQPMGPQRWIELRIPGADTRVVLFTGPGQENRNQFALSTK